MVDIFPSGDRQGERHVNRDRPNSAPKTPSNIARRTVGNVVASLGDLIASTGSTIDSAVNETVVRLAVTGLSRAGKTTFITSVINNLLALGNGRETLPALSRTLGKNNRLNSIHIVPPAAASIPFFEYASKLANLASDTPTWPSPTDDLAQITLQLDVERTGLSARLLLRRRIRLEILDYPGEWLVDLPLLTQGYREWSTRMMETVRRSPRETVFREFLNFLVAFDPGDEPRDEMIRLGHSLYKKGLLDCRERLGLRYLQPGRFLCPGTRAEAPFMWFFPCIPDDDRAIRRGSAGALLRERFEAYQADMRTNFFDSHFTNFDRQIVLVDVLSALHAGKEAFEDTRRVLGDVAASMSYGWSLPRPIQKIGATAANVISEAISKSMQSRRVTRVAFVATKADHVPKQRRDNLEYLMREMVGEALHHVDKRPVTFHVASSVLSTKDGTRPYEGKQLEVVLGIKLGEEAVRPFYPGDVPARIPDDGFWANPYFEMPVFKPPRIDPGGGAGIPNLGLDAVLTSILKGVL